MNAPGVAVGVVLLLLLFGSKAGPPPGVSSPGTDWEKVYLNYAVGDAADVTFDGKPWYVLAEGQPDPVPVAIERAASGAMQGASPEFFRMFKRQVEDPAGRVRCSDVQPYHYQLAQAMLTGQLPRDDKRGHLYARMLERIKWNQETAENLQIAQQVINGIAGFIPVIGTAIKLAVGTGIGEGVKGHLQNALNEAEALQALDDIAVGMGAHSPEGRMWLSNEDANKPPEQDLVHGTEVFSVGLSASGGYYERIADGVTVFAAEAVRYVTVTEHGSTFEKYTVRDGYRFVRVGTSMRLFAMHQYGWILAWLSPMLASDSGDLAKQVGVTAGVLRAFDIVRAKTFPIQPDGTGQQQRYFFVNPKLGPVLGATLPPTSEDTRYSAGLTHYDYDGTDISAGIINRNSTFDTRAEATRTGQDAVYIPGVSPPVEAPAGVSGEDYGQAAELAAAQVAAQSAYVPPSAPLSDAGAALFSKVGLASRRS